STDLEVQAAVDRAIKQLLAVERSAGGDAIDFRDALLDFGIDGGAVAFLVRIIRSLHSQFTDALQVAVDFVQVAFSSLGQRNAVVGVTGSLSHAADLSGHAVGNGLAGSVVLGAVDAQAGGQALDGGAQG